MNTRIVALAIRVLLTQLPTDSAKRLVDDLLDRVESQYADNAAVLAAINWARRVIDVPDNIGGDAD